MTERQLAYYVATSGVAKRIVDNMGGVTLGGVMLSELYLEMMYRSCPNKIKEIDENAAAMRHWVSSVGYADDGDFEVIMNSSINS